MWLAHHGIKGQQWGIRNGPPYPLDHPRTLFISGSSKTQSKDNPYYRKKLPKEIRSEIDSAIKAKKRIIIGDAPGIDRQVQDYLKRKRYSNVEVYGPGKQVRYSANKKWKTNPIESGKYKPDTDEWRAEKDKVMSKLADEGLAVVLENGGAGATRDNIKRMLDRHKDVKIYELSSELGDRYVGQLVLQSRMKKIKYDNTDHKLKSANQVIKDKSGNCHDQVMLELKELKSAGLKPKAAFVMEYNPKTFQGGTTHSFVYYKDGGKVKWFENAWGDKKGIHEFNSFDEIKKEIEKIHKKDNAFGNNKEFTKLAWGQFNAAPGDSLQDIVDKSLKKEI